MAEGDDPTALATMGDIKAIEKAIGSTIDAKFLELQTLILQLKEAQVIPPNPTLEDALSTWRTHLTAHCSYNSFFNTE